MKNAGTARQGLRIGGLWEEADNDNKTVITTSSSITVQRTNVSKKLPTYDTVEEIELSFGNASSHFIDNPHFIVPQVRRFLNASVRISDEEIQQQFRDAYHRRRIQRNRAAAPEVMGEVPLAPGGPPVPPAGGPQVASANDPPSSINPSASSQEDRSSVSPRRPVATTAPAPPPPEDCCLCRLPSICSKFAQKSAFQEIDAGQIMTALLLPGSSQSRTTSNPTPQNLQGQAAPEFDVAPQPVAARQDGDSSSGPSIFAGVSSRPGGRDLLWDVPEKNPQQE